MTARTRLLSPAKLLIGEHHDRILRALATYHYLTPEQVRRLYYRNSTNYVAKLLATLTEYGYLQRLPLRPLSNRERGSVYRLGSRGRAYLTSVGVAPEPYFRPSDGPEFGYLHLRHSIASSDALLRFEILERAAPAIHVVETLSEQTLKRRTVTVQLADGKKTGVAFDGWVDVTIHDGNERWQQTIGIEVDLATMHRAEVQKKIEALISFASGPYEQAFGVPGESLTIAFIAAAGGDKRLSDLLNWTRLVLQRRGLMHEAPLFRFAAADLAIVEPEFYLAPIWYQPFVDRPMPLIELPGERGV